MGRSSSQDPAELPDADPNGPDPDPNGSELGLWLGLVETSWSSLPGGSPALCPLADFFLVGRVSLLK